MACICQFAQVVLLFAVGRSHYQVSSKFIKDGGIDKNLEFYEDIENFLKFGWFGLQLGRIVLVLLSMRWLTVTRAFIFYETLIIIMEQFMPLERPARDAMLQMIATSLITFALNYFTVWYGLLCSLS